MEQSTKNSLMRYYASMTVEELLEQKHEIGEHLRFGRVKNMDDMKVSIAIINVELKMRNENEQRTVCTLPSSNEKAG